MRIHTWGEGPQHLFGIHGWGGGHQTFEPLRDLLKSEVTFHTFDLPGYGDSPRLPRWRVELLTDALVDLVDRVDTPTMTLVGNCSGACFGLPLAAALPERFDALVLIDPFAFFPWYFRLLSADGVGRLFYATAFSNPVGRWVTDFRLRAHRTDDSHLTSSFERLDHGVVHAYLRMLRQLPPRESFAHLSMPITIVHGERTFDAIRESVLLWKQLWPHSIAIELQGAGHLPIQEATQSLAEVLQSRRSQPSSNSRR